MTSGRGSAAGWSSQGTTTSPGLVGKGLGGSGGIEGCHRGERRAALHDHVSAVKIEHDYITSSELRFMPNYLLNWDG